MPENMCICFLFLCCMPENMCITFHFLCLTWPWLKVIVTKISIKLQASVQTIITSYSENRWINIKVQVQFFSDASISLDSIIFTHHFHSSPSNFIPITLKVYKHEANRFSFVLTSQPRSRSLKVVYDDKNQWYLWAWQVRKKLDVQYAQTPYWILF